MKVADLMTTGLPSLVLFELDDNDRSELQEEILGLLGNCLKNQVAMPRKDLQWLLWNAEHYVECGCAQYLPALVRETVEEALWLKD